MLAPVREAVVYAGVGSLFVSAFAASVADLSMVQTGRDLAAWIGLIPCQNSNISKERLDGFLRAGNRYLHRMLIVDAMAVIHHANRHGRI
ncbi:transposase [Sphingopyxis sp. 22461]|uniref:transposase n=1 Tax=Sphingopyxis sp. 22461 TaxID=3453923 RepID=UPI003F856085